MIELSSFSPVRQGRQLYNPLDIVCRPGSITAIMGKSGIGKTSILDSIRGDCEYHGNIAVKGNVFSIWQSNNQLFPWFTIRKNLTICNQDAESEFTQILKNWDLDSTLDRKPLSLSGGQQQRILLTMAMCSGRQNLLCDEALSSVDRPTALDIAHDFRKEAKQKNQSILWITHDKAEAELIADELILL